MSARWLMFKEVFKNSWILMFKKSTVNRKAIIKVFLKNLFFMGDWR